MIEVWGTNKDQGIVSNFNEVLVNENGLTLTDFSENTGLEIRRLGFEKVADYVDAMINGQI